MARPLPRRRRGDVTMRFIADCMLGTLAKWLLILGHDVVYMPRIEDGELVRLAVQEKRTILTRDRKLVKRRAAKDSILIKSQDLAEQIGQVLEERRLRVRWDDLFRRCLKCNCPTEPAPRDAVKDRVPVYVHRTQSRFTRCPSCDQIFWRATHVNRMLETLERRLGRPPAPRGV